CSRGTLRRRYGSGHRHCSRRRRVRLDRPDRVRRSRGFGSGQAGSVVARSKRAAGAAGSGLIALLRQAPPPDSAGAFRFTPGYTQHRHRTLPLSGITVLVSEKSTTIVHGTGESMQTGDIILAKVTRVEGFAVYIKARGHCGALGLSGEGDPPYLGG